MCFNTLLSERRLLPLRLFLIIWSICWGIKNEGNETTFSDHLHAFKTSLQSDIIFLTMHCSWCSMFTPAVWHSSNYPELFFLNSTDRFSEFIPSRVVRSNGNGYWGIKWQSQPFWCHTDVISWRIFHPLMSLQTHLSNFQDSICIIGWFNKHNIIHNITHFFNKLLTKRSELRKKDIQ